MKKLLFIAALIPIAAFVFTRAPPAMNEFFSTIFSLIMCLPVFGIFYAFFKFGKWHRGFHGRMKQNGIFHQ
jgi:hypothetical protein